MKPHEHLKHSAAGAVSGSCVALFGAALVYCVIWIYERYMIGA